MTRARWSDGVVCVCVYFYTSVYVHVFAVMRSSIIELRKDVPGGAHTNKTHSKCFVWLHVILLDISKSLFHPQLSVACPLVFSLLLPLSFSVPFSPLANITFNLDRGGDKVLLRLSSWHNALGDDGDQEKLCHCYLFIPQTSTEKRGSLFEAHVSLRFVVLLTFPAALFVSR